MKVAIAQLNYTVGDVENNRVKIVESLEKAKADGADLVIFAEQSISGIPGYDLLRKNTFLELCEDALEQIASHCDSIAAIVGLPLLTQNGTISAAALIENGRVQRYIGKRNITARREMGYITPALGYEYATIAGHNCAIVVGDDISRLRDFDSSVETIISINARKYGRGVLVSRMERTRTIAFMEGKNIVLVNQVGGGADIVYDGTSCVINNRGEMAMVMKSFEEDFAIFDLEKDLDNRVDSDILTNIDRTKVLYDAACLGLKDFFAKSGYERACLGLSGGIDSSVVASIAVATLGRENVMGMIMPLSVENSVEDAVQLANNLGIEYQIIPINECYDTIISSLTPIIGGTEFDATEENILSRIRTVLLMALQNKRGYLLLNSSNKSENALGLCTLYGDTAGAISVTGDLYKGEIYAIARYINKVMGGVIPKSILERVPSADIRPDRVDAHKLPTYEVVDAIVYRMIEKGEHREEIVNAGYDSEHVELIHKMIVQSEKKRFQYPPVLRLSNCSFGHERRMPLTSKYGD